MRVPQKEYMTDEIYQLMLQCWQLDLDERPTFCLIKDELTHLFDDMSTKQVSHINFAFAGRGFQYEHYSEDLEIIS